MPNGVFVIQIIGNEHAEWHVMLLKSYLSDRSVSSANFDEVTLQKFGLIIFNKK